MTQEETNADISTSPKTIAPQIQEMRAQIAEYIAKPSPLTLEDGEESISVDDLSSRLSHFYEKIRYSVDNKEEHLLRRGAIKRMLKRRLQEQFRKGRIAPALVIEMVRAGYLKNEALPERVINDVHDIISKAVTLYESLPGEEHEILGSSENFDRVMGMAAMEIEAFLFPQEIGEICLNAMYLTVCDEVEVRDVELDEDDKNLQVYIACAKKLLGYDESDLFYMLWTMRHPQWNGEISEEEIARMGAEFHDDVKSIKAEIANELNWRVMPKLRDEAIYFSLMRESAEHNPEIWCSEQLDITEVKNDLKSIISRKYDQERKKIKKSVSRTIIYILITKTILAVIIELPYDIFVAGEIHKPALLINIFFHPILLFIVTRVIRLPKLDSKKLTVENIIDIVQDKPVPTKRITLVRKKSGFGMILSVLYVFFFVLIFALIISGLKTLQFNAVSGGLFIFFLTLAAYFGLRIRARAKKWRVAPRKVTTRDFLVDLLTLPIVQSGQWFIKKFENVNIFVFVLDFLIETPFKALVDIFDGFTHYLRDKKERME